MIPVTWVIAGLLVQCEPYSSIWIQNIGEALPQNVAFCSDNRYVPIANVDMKDLYMDIAAADCAYHVQSTMTGDFHPYARAMYSQLINVVTTQYFEDEIGALLDDWSHWYTRGGYAVGQRAIWEGQHYLHRQQLNQLQAHVEEVNRYYEMLGQQVRLQATVDGEPLDLAPEEYDGVEFHVPGRDRRSISRSAGTFAAGLVRYFWNSTANIMEFIGHPMIRAIRMEPVGAVCTRSSNPRPIMLDQVCADFCRARKRLVSNHPFAGLCQLLTEPVRPSCGGAATCWHGRQAILPYETNKRAKDEQSLNVEAYTQVLDPDEEPDKSMGYGREDNYLK